MSHLIRVFSFLFPLIYLGIASSMIYKTSNALPVQEQRAFLYLLGSLMFIVVVIVIKSFRERQEFRSVRKENNRFLSLYDEMKELHLYQKKQSMVYWNWVIGSLFFGWTIYYLLDLFYPAFMVRPEIVGIVFFASFLLGTRGIEKQKVVDEKLIQTTIKGLQIESRLSQAKYHYFSHFVKARRGLRALVFLSIRTIPFLLILYPLFHLSIVPLVAKKILFPPLLQEGVLLFASYLGIGGAIFIPFVKLYKKCRLRINVLQ